VLGRRRGRLTALYDCGRLMGWFATCTPAHCVWDIRFGAIKTGDCCCLLSMAFSRFGYHTWAVQQMPIELESRSSGYARVDRTVTMI
jgi:hypothetical protein